jgi:RNA polymerase sigma-70 factor (ECF subfamily)
MAEPMDTPRENLEESSIELIRRARQGDEQALDSVFDRYAPCLQRWARGRLPRWARDLLDTDDMVQDVLLGTFKRLEKIEPGGEGALQQYLRQALRNRVVDEVRKAGRNPRMETVDEREPDPHASPLEETIGREALQNYERSLQLLDERDRELIVARIELGLSYGEIARRFDKPSRDATRVAISRALVRLARRMGKPA